jgi:hypothetical protein
MLGIRMPVSNYRKVCSNAVQFGSRERRLDCEYKRKLRAGNPERRREYDIGYKRRKVLNNAWMELLTIRTE